MYERMKTFLHYCIDMVLVAAIFAITCLYGGISGFLMTRVINDLRLDTYITFDTGMGIVMLIFLLGWGPAWLISRLRSGG